MRGTVVRLNKQRHNDHLTPLFVQALAPGVSRVVLTQTRLSWTSAGRQVALCMIKSASEGDQGSNSPDGIITDAPIFHHFGSFSEFLHPLRWVHSTVLLRSVSTDLSTSDREQIRLWCTPYPLRFSPHLSVL
jgi:hypothetical protein